MENEVHETFIKDSDPESLAAVARLKRSLFPMYPGVSTPRKKCGKNSGSLYNLNFDHGNSKFWYLLSNRLATAS